MDDPPALRTPLPVAAAAALALAPLAPFLSWRESFKLRLTCSAWCRLWTHAALGPTTENRRKRFSHFWKRASDRRLSAVASVLREGLPEPRRAVMRAMGQSLSRAVTEGAMPSFAGADVRSSYIAAKVMTRSTNICNVLLLPSMHDVLRHITTAPTGTLRVASVGGGPGFDALGLGVLVELLFKGPLRLDCCVLDYEPEWDVRWWVV